MRPTAVTRPSRLAVPALALTVAVMAASVVAPQSASAARPVPSCDRVAGTTLASNAVWRILRLPRTKFEFDPVIACRRAAGPATRVRRLGYSARPTDDYGRDLVSVPQLVGNVALVVVTNEASMGGRTTRRVVDLAAGRSAAAPGSQGGTNGGPATTQRAVLTPGGALASASWPVAPVPSTSGPLVLWSAGAVEPVGTPVQSLAPSSGTGPASAGVYTLGDRGDVSRMTVAGPVRRDILARDATLRWRPMKLRQTVVAKGVTRTELAPGADLVRTRRRGAPSVVTVEFAALPSATVELAPGSVGVFKVLAAGQTGAILVAGRFADQPTVPRIRLLGDPAGAEGLQVDIPATVEAETPGHAVVTRPGAVVIAEADRLRAWTQDGTGADTLVREIPVARPYDLAVADAGAFPGTSVFYTAGDGVPALLSTATR